MATTTEGIPNEASASSGGSLPIKIAQPIGTFPSIEDFTKSALKEVVDATRSLSTYPQGASRDLYCTYPTFGKIIDQQSEWILSIISRVLKMHNIRGNIERRPNDEQFELLMECNDSIMERLNSNLDEMAGLRKRPYSFAGFNLINPTPVDSSTNAGSWNLNNKSPALKANFAATRNMERPQFKFQIPVDNSIDNPFVPKLKEKPNSLKPLAIMPEYDETGKIAGYVHPYEFELMKFEVSENQLEVKVPKLPKLLESCDWLYVDSVAKLQECLADLRKYNEIAIDVEHHSYRSFQGITCLVQLSTRDKDYIIDALLLRDDVHILNEIFTNPKIVKVLHGADSDIEWLQRDLALYIVNMFDTHQAAKALQMSRLSLSYLLKYYCNLDVDKTFQLADWRIRPLPEDLIKYARQDTHYLLYVYDRITNDLLNINNGQSNLLRSIYQRSTEICKKRYEKPIIDEEAHLDVFRKSRRIFDNRQLTALRDIYHWRDSVARIEDESYGYVLPNHMLLQISESLPREMQGIFACCNPVPPLVKQHLHTIHQIILKAREQPLVKPILVSETNNRAVQVTANDYHHVLYCPHDNSHVDEFRDDLPTLLCLKDFTEGNDGGDESSMVKENVNESNLKDVCIKKPAIKAFDMISACEKGVDSRRKAKLENIRKITPYLRYLTILPEVEREKIAEAEKLKREMAKRILCPPSSMLIKQEPGVEIKSDDDNLYTVPIKEMLKRKRNENDLHKKSTTGVKEEPNDSPPAGKRVKTVTPTDDKLKFVNLPSTRKEQKQMTAAGDGKNSNSSNSSSYLSNMPSTSKNAQIKDMPKADNASNKPLPAKDGQIQPDVVTASNEDGVVEVNSDDSDDEAPIEVPIATKPVVIDLAKKDNKYKKRNKNKFKAKQKFQHPQSSNRPIQLLQSKSQDKQEPNQASSSNFDYKNVDFKRFKGGAQRAKGSEIKGQFHPKSNSNKSQNKKFNKLFTFSNVKNNKK